MNAEEFRFLKVLDASALMRVRHRAIAECSAAFGTPREIELHRGPGFYRRQILSMTGSGTGEWLGLWQERELLGVAGLRCKREGRQAHGLIFSMYVVPERRGQGWGRKLLLAARQSLRDHWKLEECRLCVETQNEGARRLYERCGFRILRRETAAFHVDGVAHDVWVLSDRPPRTEDPPPRSP